MLALLDAGHDVVVIDNLVTGFARAVAPRATLVEANVADDDRVRATIRDHDVRAILHFAGSVVVLESVADPLKYYRNNTAATRSLIESAVAEGVPHFIFSLTAATYGTPERVPVREGDPTVPINPYGMSKLMSEAMLKDVAVAHPMNFAALRYFNVAGADPEGRTGQSTVGATHLIRSGSRRRPANARASRSSAPISTRSMARECAIISMSATWQPPMSPLWTCSSHILNAGYGRGFSVNQVLDAIDRVTNQTLDRRYEGRRAGDPGELIADNGAILATLDWTPARDDLDLIVRDALTWERKLGEMSR